MSTSSSPTFVPVQEQQRAIELFCKNEGLRIDAYAGTGKTTTLQLLAASTQKSGLYLAFNRSIADEAKNRFPARVQCATGHSIAFRGVRRSFGYPDWKLTGTLTPHLIAEAFRFPQTISFACGLILERRSYSAVLLDAVRRFLQNRTQAPTQEHISQMGALLALSHQQFASFSGQAVEHVCAVWNAMQHRTIGLPLGHDGYLKLWALSSPRAVTDYIMIDEAQDLNPVLLGVLASVDCPVVYVGDPYQQIYEWRGAVNAMDKVASRHRTLLSQSFRFGPRIAAAATIVLCQLGATQPLKGIASIDSQIARVRPDVILSRSNASVMANVLRCLASNVRCAVLGGTRDLERLLQDVRRIKQGVAAEAPELLGFQSWKDVMTLSGQPEGEHLRALVNLVQEHGEDRMLAGLARCEQHEHDAEVICATTHRAKGREWDYVCLDDDFEPSFLRAAREPLRSAYEAEMRLFYVAMTRAKIAVQVPREVARRFSIRNTVEDVLSRRKVR